MSDDLLQPGSSGDDVVELQTQLQQLNFYSGTVDGDFGPATEAAVSAYREWGGLGYGVEADGQVRTALADHVEQYGGQTGQGTGQDEYGDETSQGTGQDEYGGQVDGGAGADTMQTALAAQYPGTPAQNTSTPKVEFASGAAGVPTVNGTQMEFKVRNEGWIPIEPMTELGSYTVNDAGGNVVHGPVSIHNTIEIESGRTYQVSHDIENIPFPIGALGDGDYTVKIELVAGARRSMKFKKHMGKVKPR